MRKAPFSSSGGARVPPLGVNASLVRDVKGEGWRVVTDLRGTWDDWHSALEVDAGASSPWHQLVFDHLGEPSGRILEIACGRGGFSSELDRRMQTGHLTAADYSVSAVEKA